MLIDAEVEPAYFEGPPNLELQFPVSLSYNIAGNSRVVSTLNHETGSYTVSIVETCRETRSASLNHAGCFGTLSTNPLANISRRT